MVRREPPQPAREPTDAEVLAYAAAHRTELALDYERQRHRYTDLELQVRVRHLMLALPPDATASAVQETEARMDTLRRWVLAGQSLAALARAHSDDRSSALRDGDLGYFPRGRMVPSFEEVAFAMTRPGELSPIVRTPLGLHLIEYLGRREGTIPLDDALPELSLEALRAERARESTQPEVDRIAEWLRQGRSHVQVRARMPEARVSGQRVVRRGNVLPFPELVERAFEVTSDQPVVIGPFPLDRDRVAVMRVEVVPADLAGLTDEVRACLRRRLHLACTAADAEGCGPCTHDGDDAPALGRVDRMLMEALDEGSSQ